MNGQQLRFVEVQYSRQWWLWVTIIVMVALTVGFFGHAVREQIVHGRPVGDRPTSDTALLVTAILVCLLDVALIALLLGSHLRTEVRTDGLYLRYFPFHLSFRRIPLDRVVAVEAVTYRPLWQYGGWGIRAGRNGRAYNPTGNRGVKLSYDSGRHLLIGSQRPEELAAAIESRRAPSLPL